MGQEILNRYAGPLDKPVQSVSAGKGRNLCLVTMGMKDWKPGWSEDDWLKSRRTRQLVSDVAP